MIKDNKAIQENIEQLQNEFKSLKTIQQKFDFWRDKFDKEYFFKDHYKNDILDYFEIIPETTNDIETLNRLCIETYYWKYRNFKREKQITTYSVLLEKFDKKLKKTKNSKALIELEFHNLLSKIQKLKAIDKNHNQYEYSNFFHISFDRLFLNNERNNLKSRLYNINQLIGIVNGEAYAEFALELLKLKENKKEVRKIETPHKMQMLILEYLKFYNKLDARKKGKLLEPIINRDPETTRQNYSSLYLYKTEKNLESLLKYFTVLNFPEQIEAVKKDINRLKNKN